MNKTRIENNAAGVQRHLDGASRVNLGSYYTPPKNVVLVGEWLRKYGVDSRWTIADLSSGYGAFMALGELFPDCRLVANDIDPEAIDRLRKDYPGASALCSNALLDVRRERFGIPGNAPLAVVGNPPYNDATSIVGRGVKGGCSCGMDDGLKRRDLGMSCLLSYARLDADIVAVLHPLSYLVKEANFRACEGFFGGYRLLERAVFNSQEFAGTSKLSGFPVLVALYRRTLLGGLTYREVRETVFRTVDGDEFSPAGMKSVYSRVAKYPHSGRYSPEVLFYTLRDVNALRRSRTFLPERCANAVDVSPEQFPLYCYIDCFKRYAETPYWMGNFDVPYREDGFRELLPLFVRDAKAAHPEVFGENAPPSPEDTGKIREYIRLVVGRESERPPGKNDNGRAKNHT